MSSGYYKPILEGAQDDPNHLDPICPPDEACEICQQYWDRMRAEGLWIDGQGWTEKARQEWNK